MIKNIIKLKVIVMSFLLMASNMAIAQELRTNPRLLPQYYGTNATQTIEKDEPTNEVNIAKKSIRYNTALSSKYLVNPSALERLENGIYNAIGKKAFPGCQVLAIKDGTVIYHKAFGTLEYGTLDVDTNTYYDIASVTKIAATTLAIMKLYEEGRIQLQSNLLAYLPMTAGTDKAFLRISDLLTHQAGLKSWIPFYKYTIDSVSKLPAARFYNNTKTSLYTVPVARNLYANKRLIDTIWKVILSSPLENRGKYVYSDLDLLFLEKVVEQQSGMPLDMFVQCHFYTPMGLKRIKYNPWDNGGEKNMAPTEKDYYFRQQTIKGFVHDQAAACLGGVAGHAGLFSNAMDVAAIMQLLMDGGVYNGKRYLKAETIELFTGYRSGISRRGYGFDKPEKQVGKGGPAADIVSKEAFGHQGFTGTCAWADPEHGVVFVFLSNRVFPSAENTLINKLDVRTNTQHLIYAALGISK